MYKKSAQFYDAIYHFKDYDSECKQLDALIQKHNPDGRSLLDIACGTGKHIEYLKEHYDVEGLDINPDLLDIAAERCPGIPLHQGDMVEFDIGHRFDVITCLFSSISCTKTVKRLRESVACMARHLRPGGVLFSEPWFSPDNFIANTVTANLADEPGMKIAWMYTSEVVDNVSILYMNYMVGTPEGVTSFTEQHEMGLFTSDEYTEAFELAGLETDFDPKGLFGRGMYTATKKA